MATKNAVTKEEFDARIAAVFDLAEQLSTIAKLAPGSERTNDDRALAIALYERLVEDFDARLEMLMDDEMRHSKTGGTG